MGRYPRAHVPILWNQDILAFREECTPRLLWPGGGGGGSGGGGSVRVGGGSVGGALDDGGTGGTPTATHTHTPTARRLHVVSNLPFHDRTGWFACYPPRRGERSERGTSDGTTIPEVDTTDNDDGGVEFLLFFQREVAEVRPPYTHGHA